MASETEADISNEDEDYSALDMVFEDLTYLISPKNGGMRVEPSPPSTNSTSFSNPKVSPLITDDNTAFVNSQTSLRGVDSNNNPIYASSQTPYGFQVMTKRKTGKKSIFNFEGFDTMNEDKNLNASQEEAAYGTLPMVKVEPDTPTDSPISVQRRYLKAKPRGSATDKQMAHEVTAAAAVKVESPMMVQSQQDHSNGNAPRPLYGFDSMDETAFRSTMEGFSDEREYLEALKWNGLSPHVGALQGLPPVPTPKNPRKKAEVSDSTDSNGIGYISQQQYGQSGLVMGAAPTTLQSMDTLQAQLRAQQQAQQQYLANGGGGMYYGNFQQQQQMLHQQLQQQQAMWMNSNTTTADINSQFQYYSGDINQIQLPSIQTAPSAVIPDNNGYNFPYQTQSFVQPDPYATNVDMMNYQALLQRKVQELKLHSDYDTPTQPSHHVQSQPPPVHANAAYSAPAAVSTTTAAAIANIAHRQRQQSIPGKAAAVVADSDHEDHGRGAASGGRASKSLAEISKRFVTLYGKDNTLDYIAGKLDPSDISDMPTAFHRVDAAAEALGVHVRRIYELIKILEILSLVQFAGDKRGKFSWRGTKDFLLTLGEIQEDGMTAFPLMSLQSGLSAVEKSLPLPTASEDALDEGELTAQQKQEEQEVTNDVGGDVKKAPSTDPTSLRGSLFLMDGGSGNSFDLLNLSMEETERELAATSNATNALASSTTQQQQLNSGIPPSLSYQTHSSSHPSSHHHGHEEHFMVEIICKKFLQLFLVGMNSLSMSSAIQKLIPMEEHQSLNDYNRVNATKIRRVYDVTNVLCSLNLIRKQTISRKAAQDAENYNNVDSPVRHHDTAGANDSFSSHMSDEHTTTSTAAGGKKSSAGKGVRSIERVDAKVLEWSSFVPAVIRREYLMLRRRSVSLRTPAKGATTGASSFAEFK